MERLLFRYFRGEAGIEEEKEIVAWVDKSEENRNEFYKQRQLFDILLLRSDSRKRTGLFSWNKAAYSSSQWLRVASIAALLLILIAPLWFLIPKTETGDIILASQTVIVPEGQRTQLLMPDGSTVWLNARTTMVYNTGFGSSNRDIILDGEAYFQVNADSLRPFIVHTDKFIIEVVGTTFNVKAYSRADGFETALISGSVKVHSVSDPELSILLKPDQCALLHGNELKVETIKNKEVFLWREGLYVFEGKNFGDMLHELRDYYGVEIVSTNPDVLNNIYTGKFRYRDGLEHILEVIRKDSYFEYSYERNERLITIH